MEDIVTPPPNIFANAPKAPRWYHKTWGRIIIALLLLSLMLGVYFVILTALYAGKIKRGDIVGGMTQTKLATTVQKAPKVADASLLFGENDPSLGPTNALLTIVEFGDFECPFCRKAYPDIRAFQAAHADEVRLIWRDFPLLDVHPRAQEAAEAAACANDQAKFWAYHDKLFENQGAFGDAALSSYAQQIGLDVFVFNQCRSSDTLFSEISGDLRDSITLGNTGTPTFFVNGQRLAGAVPLELWERILELARSERVTR